MLPNCNLWRGFSVLASRLLLWRGSEPMKKLALGLIAVVSLTGAVAAADLGVKAPPVTAPPPPLIIPSTWAGFSIGAHGGYGWSTSQGLNARGGFGGGQIG